MSDCCGGVKLIYACSGAADVGALSDGVARKLAKEGYATKMTCLAGIGAGLSGYIESAKGAESNIAIDGCQIACARIALQNIGVPVKSFILTDLGYVKGQTEVTAGVIEAAAEKIRKDEALQKGKGGCCC